MRTNDPRVADIDFATTDLFHNGPPYEAFRLLREHDPVHWNPPPPEWAHTRDPAGFWSITKAADIAAIARDADGTSVDSGITLNGDIPVPVEFARSQLTGMDPPRHTKYRKLLAQAFTPRTVAAQTDAIRDRTTRLLDAMMSREEHDFVRDFAIWLPIQVIADMLGLPAELHHQLYMWTENLVFQDRDDGSGLQIAAQAFVELMECANTLATERVKDPKDDLITRLLNAEDDGDKFDQGELGSFVTQLIVAGNETTRNALAGGIHAFAENPQQWRRLRDEPALMGTAVEEILRWSSPLLYMRRTATKDLQLGGKHIKAGDKLVQWYASANRDDELNATPDLFDVTRPDVKHVSFGGGGFRFCLGAALSRLELRVALEEFVRRMGSIEVAGTPRWRRASFLHGLASLPVRIHIDPDRRTTSASNDQGTGSHRADTP